MSNPNVSRPSATRHESSHEITRFSLASALIAALVAGVGCTPTSHDKPATPGPAGTQPVQGDPSLGDAGQPDGAADRGGLVATPAGLRIALLGDQGVGANAQSVLRLIANERADAIIHLGDLSYDEAAPSGWDQQIDDVLGANFPYFAVIGNHDVGIWQGPDGLAARLLARLARVPDAQCSGEYGVDTLCRFRGLAFVLSGVGTYGTDHEAFLDSALAGSDAIFRLCIWHKNQHDMQVGAKSDEVGWPAYQVCARHGVPIITGHEHSYARTRTLAAIGDRSQAHGALDVPDRLELAPGRTFVVVAGLGGESARSRTTDHATDTWWASIYARDYQLQNGTLQGTDPEIAFGALFIEFNVDADPHAARGYFKTVDGVTQDAFTFVVSADGPR